MKTLKPRDNLILIGMPAVGKSTVGVLLAKRLGYAFVDTDLVIQQKEGMLLPALIRRYGLDGFCDLEASHVSRLAVEHSVIATGGSVVYRPAAMEHLKSSGTIIYLAIGLPDLTSRLSSLDERGVIRQPGQSIAQLHAERSPLYVSYAAVTVNTTGHSPDQVVRSILEKRPLDQH